MYGDAGRNALTLLAVVWDFKSFRSIPGKFLLFKR